MRADRVRRWLAAGLAAAMVTVLGGCGGEDEPEAPPGPLRIATGNPGGVYIIYGEGIAEVVGRHLPQLRAKVLQTEASVQNLQLLAAGGADVAFTLADVASDAVKGNGPFAEPLRISAVARLYDNFVQLVVPADSPIERVGDLAGHVVATGSAGSGTSLIAHRILGAAGLDPAGGLTTVDQDLEASTEAMRTGEIDAFFWSGGLPTRAVSDLAEAMPIRLIDLGDQVAALASTYDDLYASAQVPASVYGLPQPVTTVSVPNYLVVPTDADEGLVYQLTSLLFTYRDELEAVHPEARRLNLRSAIATYPLDLHPGAVRYYRDVKD